MAYLTLLLETKVWATGAWGTIINLFSFIGNYGWMIIVFTICLKLAMTPFDFMQKHTTTKNQKMMALMQPELDKLQAKYADNKEMLQQKQMEVYKKYNYNVVGSCLFMLLGMAIPMFIFFSLFGSLNQISAIKIYNQYDGLKNHYEVAYDVKLGEGATEDEATAFAREKVLEYYETNAKESWLWIDNVWKGDKATSIVPTYEEYTALVKESLTEEEIAAAESMTDEEKAAAKAEYDKIMYSIVEKETGWNGYYILALFAGGTTFFSTWVAQRASKKKLKDQLKAEKKKVVEGADATAGAGNIMMFVLPIIMVIFTLTSSAIFSLYIITSSLIGIATQPLYNLIFNAIDKRMAEKKMAGREINYSRDKLYK